VSPEIRPGNLVLADGTVFGGELIGAELDDYSTGEVVFNTTMCGYQEVLTDPSYAGQIITFTYPHIGNYGVNAADDEAAAPACSGVIVRELARRHSSWRSEGSLSSLLRRHNLAGLAGIDTRRLTRHIRSAGSMPAAFGAGPLEQLTEGARSEPSTDGVDLVSQVTCAESYTVPASAGASDRRIVAFDFGIKRAILVDLSRLGHVEVVPASTPASEVLAREPDGVFLSNGPGDPAAVGYATESIASLLGEVPVFGICLGHQLMSSALGASTYKLPFGHHGGNHPVCDLESGTIEITSQNHNYAVAEGSITAAKITHQNLNDGVIEGIACNDVPAFSVQYHPEASPGPHDSTYLFDRFAQLMDAGS
jgi:carbamoyl-phosphate synthase small subunit